MDPQALLFLASSLGAATYLTLAMVCAAAGARRGFALLKLGQWAAVASLLLFWAGLWGKGGDWVLWVRLWGTSTLTTLALTHSGAMVLARKPLWLLPVAVLATTATWVLAVGLPWVLWTFRFDDPTVWKVGLTCLLLASLGSAGVLGGHVYASVTARIRERDLDDNRDDAGRSKRPRDHVDRP